MTREEQIRSAAFDASTNNDDYKKYAKDSIARMFFVEGAKWADENPKSQWISVEDKLPEITVPILEESDFVFVHVVNKDTGHEWVELPAKYNKQFQDWMTNDFTWINKRGGVVTHWMPIPKLQEE